MLNKTVVKIYCLTFIIIIVFSDCSTNQMMTHNREYQTKLDKINYLGSKYPSEIYLLDKTIINTSYLICTSDMLLYEQDEIQYKLPLGRIDRIRIKDQTESLFGGLWTGLGVSVFTIAILELTSNGETGHTGTAPLMLAGALYPIGAIIGYFFTGKNEFIFNSR